MNETITQLGLGGLIVYLGFKEMLAFMAKHNGKQGNASGEKPTSYWELTFTRLMDKSLEPVARDLTEILRLLRTRQR